MAIAKLKTKGSVIFTSQPKVLWGKIKSVRLIGFVKIVGWAVLILFPSFCLFEMEYVHFADKAAFMKFINSRTQVILFDLAVIYLIYTVLLLIFKRGWAAALILGASTTGAAIASYFKFRMTGDYFYPWDIVQTKNIHILMDYIITPYPILYILLAAFVAVCVIYLMCSRNSIPLKWFVRLPIAALIVLSMAYTVQTPDDVTKLLNNNSLFLEDMALQQSNYQANGFTGATIVNILSGNIAKPEGYSEEAVGKLLDGYDYIDADIEYNYPDVILILSESFWDPKRLPNTKFAKNPLSNYDELTQRENCYSGSFYSTAFGGGTIRPEFEVITGLTTDTLPSGCVPYQYITYPIESYLTQYKKSDYKAIAIHPYLSSFYFRKQAFKYLGFDSAYFTEDLLKLEDVTVNYRGGQISDDSFVNYIMKLLDSAESRTFIFGISMENHQPYGEKFDKHEIKVTNPNLDPQILSIVENYTQGVCDADNALKKLADFIDSRERDTVLVYYGDHAPSLGSNYAAYQQSGMIGDISNITIEERDLMQSTPFLIYSNFELKESTMFTGKTGNKISSYNLMNALSTLIGSPRTEFMQYLDDYYKNIPYYNSRLNLSATDEVLKYIKGHAIITYDRIAGGKYSEN